MPPSNYTTWRKRYSTRTYLYVYRPPAVFRARVNQPSAIYPLEQILYDTVTTGAFGDVMDGMLMTLGSSADADDLGRLIIKGGANGSTIFLARTSEGKHDGEVHVVDNAYITVYDFYPVYALIPFINNSGQQFKNGSDIFVEGEDTKPVANAGGPRIAFCDPITETATFDFNANASFSQIPFGLDYEWDFVDGTPSSSTDINPTGVEFPVGARYVRLTVTDINGFTHTKKIPVVVCTRQGAHRPFDAVTGTLSTPEDGQTLTVRILEPMPYDEYLDGTYCILFKEEFYGGVRTNGLYGVTSGNANLLFYGWHQSSTNDVRGTKQGIRAGLDLTFVDVAGRLKTLPGFPQTVEYKVAAATWAQMTDANIDRYVLFLLRWHSTALEVADFIRSGTGSTYAFTVLESGANTLWAQGAERTAAIRHSLTCDRYTRIMMKPNPQLQNSEDRDSTDILFLQPHDIASIRWSDQRPPRVHWINGDALIASSNSVQPVFAIAPGSTPGQGAVAQGFGRQLVQTQEELNDATGHAYANENGVFGLFDIDSIHNGDAGVEPALKQYMRINVESYQSGPREREFISKRVLPLEVVTTFDGRIGSARRKYRCEYETVGYPAQTVVQTPGNFGSTTPPKEIFPDPLPGGASGTGTIGGFTTGGQRFYTTQFSVPGAAGGPSYTVDNATVTGDILSFVQDAYVSGAGWLLTSDGTNMRIYRYTNMFASTSYTLKATSAASGTLYGGTIQSSRSEQNFVVAAWFDSVDGTQCLHTQDDSTYTQDTVTATGSSGFEPYPAIHVSEKTAGKVFVTAYTTVDDGELYVSLDHGATWAVSTDPEANTLLTLSGFVHFPFADNPTESICFIIRNGGGPSFNLLRVQGTTQTVVTPTPSGTAFPLTQFGLSTPGDSALPVAFVGINNSGVARFLCVASDGGLGASSWTSYNVSTELDQYTANPGQGMGVVLPAANTMYIFGGLSGDPKLYFSANSGLTRDDRSGNLAAQGATGYIVNIVGG